VQLNSYSAIDDALRLGTPARFFGKDFDLTPFLGLGKEKARQFVSALASKVGVPNDIDNILLSGGGASFFLEALQERFPRHQITFADEPVFANVRGFQRAGEQWARQREDSLAVAS
jgi:plasmid segregation protein ParM